ncbi:hypothetical protein QE152_g37449 [Popillia japonica]|uniref:DUF4806 domain-containing protein n=1 Tax=Popillia japonica TaxID=7064 RepID=A0AAW1IA42_POPJA
MDTWTVVKFKDENSVEAVPSDWILDNQCYWPPYTADKIKSSIIEHEAHHGHCLILRQLSTEVFRNSTFDNYLQPRTKSRKADFTSDLNSDDGAETIKRKVHKRREVSVTKNIGVYTAVTSDSNTASSDNTDCTCCGIYNKNGELLKGILQQQNLIRYAITDILAKIMILQTKQLTTTVDEGVSLYNIFHFPLKNKNELLEVESFLEKDDNLASAVNEVSKLGGNSTYAFIRRSLSSLVTNELAAQYSCFGAKKENIW